MRLQDMLALATPDALGPGVWVPASYGAYFVAIVGTGAGLPVPEDAVLLGAGCAIARGGLRWPLTLALGFIGVLLGDVLLYAMGRAWGHALASHPRLARRFPPERLAAAGRLLDRFGDLAIVLARFVMGARAAVYFLSGSLRRPLGRFLLVDALACIVHVPLLLALGEAAGARVETVAQRIGDARLAALVAFVLALGIAWVVRSARRRRRDAP